MNRWFSWQALTSRLAVAGLGLLVWLGISIALLQEQGGGMVLLRHVQFLGLAMACVLVATGLVGLQAGAASPAGVRWTRIAGAVLLLALALGVALAWLLGRKPFQATAVAPLAGLLTLAALATVLVRAWADCVAGRADWRRQMLVPGLLCYALLAGAALLFALLAIKWPAQGMLPTLAPSLMLLAALMAGLKLIYWFENGGLRAPVAGYDASALLRMRLGVLGLLALLPLLLALMLFTWPTLAPRLGWCLIVLSVLGGGVLDRRLQDWEAGRA